MFYATDKNDHGLPHDPFKAIVAPHPIGWITTMSASGAINLAPYSYFNGVLSRPPVVMFSSEGRKDSLAFVEETREFVCNLATWDLREKMNQTSAPTRAAPRDGGRGLTAAPSRLVKPPRVAESPCAPSAATRRPWRCTTRTAPRSTAGSSSGGSSGCISTSASSATVCSTRPRWA